MVQQKEFPLLLIHYSNQQLRQKQPSYSYTLPSGNAAMGTKTAVSFANIFMAHIETTILSRTVFKPTVWKRYIDDIFSLWDISKPNIEAFIEQANLITSPNYQIHGRNI